MKIRIVVLVTFLAACLINSSKSIAQYPVMGHFSVGVTAGIDITSFNGTIGGGGNNVRSFNTGSNYYLPGYNFGVNVDVPIAKELYFEPGLLFNEKGSGINGTDSLIRRVTLNSKYHTSNIDIPMLFLYKTKLGLYNISFFAGAGPYIGFGIGGKRVIQDSTTQSIKFQSADSATEYANQSNAYFRNPDGGVEFLIGMEFPNNLSVIVRGELGLLNINEKFAGGSVRNISFGVGVNYRFGKK